MNDRTKYIIDTVIEMEKHIVDAELLLTFQRLKDTIWHTAPEIASQRWGNIFNLCIIYLNDEMNGNHVKCCEIYNNRLTEYSKLYQ